MLTRAGRIAGGQVCTGKAVMGAGLLMAVANQRGQSPCGIMLGKCHYGLPGRGENIAEAAQCLSLSRAVADLAKPLKCWPMMAGGQLGAAEPQVQLAQVR